MSQLESLIIRGIRSYDQAQKVDFYSPLTLICGHNGSGKTSIIESLKYSTTGELPPNSKQGAFIHDPKLSNECQTKAQVKLRFRNLNGVEMVCTRSIELTCTIKKYTTKTLESLLLIRDPETGHQYSISSKCSEIDSEIPNHLGVSKPILENVVFCHQEDSYWPLSEPSILKKKFDEIFAATRYTKALDNIKQLRKQLSIDLKIHDTNLKNEKINKDRAAKVSIELEISKRQGDEIQCRILELDGGKIDDLVVQMKKLIDKQQDFQLIQSKIDQTSLERDLITKNIESINSSVQLLNDDDHLLQSNLENYQNSINNQSGRNEELGTQKNVVNDEIRKCNQQLSILFTDRGKFGAEQEVYEKLVGDCTTLYDSLMQKYAIGQILYNDPNKITKLIVRLEQEVRIKNTDLTQFREQSSEIESCMTDKLLSLKSSLAGLEETKKMSATQIASIQSKIIVSNTQIRDLDECLLDLENTDEMIQQQQQDIDFESTKLQNAERESSLPAMNRNLQELENRAQDLQSEIQALGFQVDSRAKLSLKKQELARKDDIVSRLSTSISTDCQSLFEYNLPTLDTDAKLAQKNKELASKSVQDHHMINTSKLSAIDSNLTLLSSNINSKEAELDLKKKKVAAFGDYNSLKVQTQVELEQQRNMVQSMKSAASMYSKFITKFQGTKCCPICVRGFASSEEELTFLRKLEGVLNRVPEATKVAENDYSKIQRTSDELMDLQPIFDDVERLSVEVEDLKLQISNFENLRIDAANLVEDSASEIAILQVELLNSNNILQRSNELLRTVKEKKSLEIDVQLLIDELSMSGVRSFEEVSDLLENVNLEIKSLRLKIDRSVRETQIRQNGLSARQNKLRDLKESALKIKFQVKERENLAVLVSESKKEMTTLEKKLSELSGQKTILINQVSDALLNLQSHKDQAAKQDSQLFSYNSSLKNSLQELSLAFNQTKRDNPNIMFRETQLLIDAQEASLKGLKTKLNDIVSQLEQLTLECAQVEMTCRNIRDNLSLRLQKSQIVSLDRQIVVLDQRLQKSNHQTIESQYSKLKARHESLVGERAGLVGELKQVEEQARRFSRQLETDYKDIERLYISLKVKVKSTQMSIEDLEKYSLSLDSAIMKFHGIKMAEINKIIRELWIKTYRGIDIDTIEIRSDPDKSESTRKLYNYRVVMVRGDVEMDMRGRCSAGQKVLAAIIIRLALAETFCLHCGVFALDEPTTNLDSDNARSLAQALVSIIESRSGQRNFQLIIITHDEEFMRFLGRGEYADYYWRVAKDRRYQILIRGCSTITRKLITEE